MAERGRRGIALLAWGQDSTARGTLWEIHPITRIEVGRDSTWVELDRLP